jgi:hypothetical protein
MTLFFSIHVKHHTACLVLLAWLFALGSGIANACVLNAQQTHSHIATHPSPEDSRPVVILPAHAGALADGVGGSHSNAPCLKVCDDGTRSFPKQESTVTQIDPGTAFLVLVLWGTVAPVFQTLHQIDHEQPAKPRLPIRVRFSRLTI